MMSAPDDRPLTITDLCDGNGRAPLGLLAARVASHLDGDWSTSMGPNGGTLLEESEGLRLGFFAYNGEPYNPREFYIRTFTDTGRPVTSASPMSVYTLPSNIAAHLESAVIPPTRLRLAKSRELKAVAQARNDRRKDRIAMIAETLNWNSSSYKTQSGSGYASLDPRLGRRRERGTDPALEGSIAYAEGSGDTMQVWLTGLPEDLVDTIVDLVASRFPTSEPDHPVRKNRRRNMKIESIDNRGDARVAFGYVYFDDGARVGYANMPDPETGNLGWELTGPGGGPWTKPTAKHKKMALDHLREHGAKMPEAADTE